MMINKSKGLKKTLLTLISILFMLIALTPLVSVQAKGSIPSPSFEFYVYDEASIIGNEVSNYIIQTNEDLFKQTNAQVVVAIVNSLDGESLEEYANELYRQWGIGGLEEDNGVLLFVALEERSLRIEVGYGLEGAIPDGKAGQIRDQYILPYFQQNQYEQGVLQGFQAITHEIEKEYQVEIIPRNPEEYGSNAQSETQEMSPLQKIIIIIVLIGFLFIDFTFFGGMLTFTLLRSVSRGNYRGGGRGGGNRGGGGSSGGGGASGGW